jgi:hypothetical protein
MDASLSAGPSSPWYLVQQTQKHVVLVCKQTSTFLLCQDVHLRRIGQVAALLNTLQGNARLGMMIKVISVPCYVTPQYSVMFDEALRRISEMSPNATRLSLNMSVCEVLTPSISMYDLSRIVYLEVGDTCLLEILPCLAQCSNLTILSIDIRGITDTDTLTVEHLRELQICPPG